MSLFTVTLRNSQCQLNPQGWGAPIYGLGKDVLPQRQWFRAVLV